nr:MAG TPA_asm: hypothetical protein [Caudoviricetes sp.]
MKSYISHCYNNEEEWGSFEPLWLLLINRRYHRSC